MSWGGEFRPLTSSCLHTAASGHGLWVYCEVRAIKSFNGNRFRAEKNQRQAYVSFEHDETAKTYWGHLCHKQCLHAHIMWPHFVLARAQVCMYVCMLARALSQSNIIVVYSIRWNVTVTLPPAVTRRWHDTCKDKTRCHFKVREPSQPHTHTSSTKTHNAAVTSHPRVIKHFVNSWTKWQSNRNPDSQSARTYGWRVWYRGSRALGACSSLAASWQSKQLQLSSFLANWTLSP